MARKNMGMAGYVTDREVSEWRRSRHEYRPQKQSLAVEVAWIAFVFAAALAFFYVSTWAAAIIDCM